MLWADAIQRIFLLSPVMMCTFDWEGHYTMVNPVFPRTLGYTDEELLGKHYLTFVHPDDVEATLVKDRILHESETTVSSFEVRMRCKDGSYRLQLWDVSSAPEDRVFYGVGKDVTEMRDAERDLAKRRADVAHRLRLETMGNMASELAHEVNQPFAAIANYARAAATGLRRGTLSLEECSDALTRISEQASRGGALVQRMRSFTRKSETVTEDCDLNQLAGGVANLASAGRRSVVCISLRLEDSLPLVRGEPAQLEQVILNLVDNAIDAAASQPGARIEIETERIGNDGVRLTVFNDGVGLIGEDLTRVFQPFYTTKPDGLGLGLAISRSIVETHGGKIFAAPGAIGGTRFVVELPTSSAEA